MSTLKHRLLSAVFRRYYSWRLHEFTSGYPILLDYPVQPRPRYPIRRRPHPQLWEWFNDQREECDEALGLFEHYRSQLEAIRLKPEQNSGRDPSWHQPWFSALDGMAAYALVASRRPARIIEVGSGNSTKFMARAIHDWNLETRLISIDPQPRAEIDALCHQVLRQPLEDVDQALFTELQSGDFLFIDNSHRAFTNSDVTTFFLDILPNLKRGLILHLHDILLPWDYPEEWSDRYYSEQYLLACWLLAGPQSLRLLLSNAFVSFDPQFGQRVRQYWAQSSLASMFAEDYRYGGVSGLLGVSFWAET
jgi:predicted O-methyltransferase YrrM